MKRLKKIADPVSYDIKKDLLELQQTIYESKNPTRQWLHRSRRDWIIEAIRRYLPSGQKKALEIGPGSGVYLPVLASLFNEVTAVDIEDAYLDHAQRLAALHPNLTLVADDITRSHLPTGSFDLILCSEVIEHIPVPAAALAEMHRLLTHEGILILSTPQRYSTLELAAKVAFMPGIVQLVRLIYGEAVREMGHISLMTAQEIRFSLAASGFHLLEHFKSGMYLPLIAEFMGASGLQMEAWLEGRLRSSFIFSNLLWTQYFVAKAGKNSKGSLYE